jgi:hypothetical protein
MDSPHRNPSVSTVSLTNQLMATDSLPEIPWINDTNQRSTNQPAETCIYHDNGGLIMGKNDCVFQDMRLSTSQTSFDFMTADLDWQQFNSMEFFQNSASDPTQVPTGILTDISTSGYAIPLPPSIVDDLLVSLNISTAVLTSLGSNFFLRKSSASFQYSTPPIFVRDLKFATQT